MKAIETALKFKTTIYVLVLILIVMGYSSYKALPLEDNPEVEIPFVMVHTLYYGVAPADMERLVTNILERELKDISDVRKMTSSSAESISMINLEFESGVDMDTALQKVRDKVDMAKSDLPVDAEDPMVIEFNFSEFPILLVNISADYGLMKLKQVAENLQDKIESVPGVLEAELTGGLEREIQIYLDPQKMEHHRLGVGQVIMRIQQEHLTTPAGNLELGISKYAVRIPGEYKNVSQMEQIVLTAPSGKPVKLGDIGRVVDGTKEPETISRANGEDCVTLRVKKRSGENIVSIADQVKALIEKEKPFLPAGTQISIPQDTSQIVRDTVNDLNNSIITGLLLVLIVLFFAMGFRNASFVAFAIPMSMLITFIVLRIQGLTLNMVVLFSLILALGMLVDNSIVVVENIFRRASEGMPRQKAALEGTKEVIWPIIASTATTIVAFAPMLFWPGIMGQFMVYLPKTVITALLATLFVAAVINPVIAGNFLKAKGRKLFDDSGKVQGRILPKYKAMLTWCLDRPGKTMGIAAAVFLFTITIFAFFNAGVEFFPNTTPERIQAFVKAPQGTTLNTTDSYARKIEADAMADENFESVITNVGVGEMFTGISSDQAMLDLKFKHRDDQTRSPWESMAILREKISKYAGARFRVEKEKEGPPAGPPISIEISGPDYERLSKIARQVKELVRTIPGAVDLKDDFEGGKPEIKVDIDREKARIRTVSTAQVSQAVRTAINGTKASVLREGDEEYDITVRYDADYRSSINDLLDIRITGENDVQVPLRDIATVTTTGGLGSIKHIDQVRTILVSGEVTAQRSSSEVMIDVQALLTEKLTLPEDYKIYFSGESEEQEKAAKFLSEAFSIGLLFMALILITQFNSVLRPAIILGSVVMSLVGVLLGLVLTQSKFGIIMTGMGVISLAGVVVNNAIVLIDYTDRIRKQEGLTLRDALLRAGVVRFRPVLLTAITTILGMLPMAIGVSIDFVNFKIETGATTMQWWGPMAKAIIFGLSFATILTLVMVPVMYLAQENGVSWTAAKYRNLINRLKLAKSKGIEK